MLNVIMVSDVMLNVIMVSVIMLNVLVPIKLFSTKLELMETDTKDDIFIKDDNLDPLQ
jgi:hypothetical protein